MSVGIELILSTALVAVPAGCSWAHPGANPYRGDPVQALGDFDMAPATRAKLRALMTAHRTTDIARITRDDIVGAQGYADLREMHSGHGQVCHGAVDRSAWSPTRQERGLVYCVDDVCVIVPTICNNVSLVTRKPDGVAVLDDSPIDIEPAAGPRPAPAEAPVAPAGETMSPDDFLVVSPTDDTTPPAVPGGGGGGSGGAPGGGFPIGGLPIGSGGGGGIGGPCCSTGPVGPGTPPVTPVPPTSAVPESPTSALMLAGLAALATVRRWRQARSRKGCACAGHGDTKNASTIAASTSATVAGFQRGA